MGTAGEEGSRRPRVVDKRVSARPVDRAPTSPADSAEPPSTPPPEQGEQGAPAPPPTASPRPDPGQVPEEARLWTPEQEAEMQRVAQEVRDTPSADWVLSTSVTLANVAAAKLDAGLAAEAQLAIDALAGVVNAVGHRLGDSEAPLRNMLAQLQLAFAQGAGPPPHGG
jgi:hypothetical protein